MSRRVYVEIRADSTRYVRALNGVILVQIAIEFSAWHRQRGPFA